MNLAVRWEIPGITKNPTKYVPLFEDTNKKPRYLTETEVQVLYCAVKASVNPMLQYIIPMLILTGARKREVLDAKWEEFDLECRQWRVSVTKAGKPRYVPLSDGAMNLLTTMPRDNRTWAFPNPKTGKPYVSIFCTWDTARNAAGLADVRIHDLRPLSTSERRSKPNTAIAQTPNNKKASPCGASLLWSHALLVRGVGVFI